MYYLFLKKKKNGHLKLVEEKKYEEEKKVLRGSEIVFRQLHTLCCTNTNKKILTTFALRNSHIQSCLFVYKQGQFEVRTHTGLVGFNLHSVCLYRKRIGTFELVLGQNDRRKTMRPECLKLNSPSCH